MKSLKTVVIIACIIGGIIAIKYIFFQNPDTKQSGSATGNAKPAVGVHGIVVKEYALDHVLYATGSILANESVELRAEASGIIKSISFTEGTNVLKNQLLVKINDADLQAQLSKQVADLEVMLQKEKRMKQLFDKEGASAEELEDASNKVASLKSEINYSKAIIAKTEVRAPFNGVAGLRNISEGSFINSQTSIATLQQLNPVKVEFSIPDNYAGTIKKGDEIKFTVSGNSRQLTGKVFAIEPKVDAATRTLRMRAICANDAQTLVPGTFARVQLITQKNNQALLIPTQAVVPILKGKQVFIARGGRAETASIETGIRNDATIEVIRGISIGDTIITSGLMQLKPGAEIKFISVK